MKLFHVLAIALCCFAIPFSSCTSGADKDAREKAREALPQGNPDATTATPTSPVNNDISASATNPAGEPHYKCPNNCEGGIGAGAGNCPVCGTAMAHNQAFHNTPSSTPTTPPTGSPNATTPAAPAAPAAATNAAGVYHYICSKGCAGGAGAAGNCATCGNALTHNQAYHN